MILFCCGTGKPLASFFSAFIPLDVIAGISLNDQGLLMGKYDYLKLMKIVIMLKMNSALKDQVADRFNGCAIK